MEIVKQLNSKLPSEFEAEPRVHLGAAYEIDVSAFEKESSATGPQTDVSENGGQLAATWSPGEPTILLEYAVVCRPRRKGKRWRVDAWQHELAIGQPLPMLPLWLNEKLYVPVDLEASYEETCRGVRIR